MKCVYLHIFARGGGSVLYVVGCAQVEKPCITNKLPNKTHLNMAGRTTRKVACANPSAICYT